MINQSFNEKFAEQWLIENEFKILEIKTYISKTKYTISKYEIEDVFELPYMVTDIEKYMDFYNHSFNMKVELIDLRKKR